jgi:hypothetical protein
MTIIASDTQRLSNVVKNEWEAGLGLCRKTVIARETAETQFIPGRVLARTLVSGTATSSVNTGTLGNGTMGTITVYANAKKGTYTLKFLTSGATASFAVYDPDGLFVGQGAVASAFTGGGLSFTQADGATDFSAGESLSILVAGTEKYSTVSDATVTEDLVIFLSGVMGSDPITVAADTDTQVVVMNQGPSAVADAALILGATVNTDDEKAAVYKRLEAKGIRVLVQV